MFAKQTTQLLDRLLLNYNKYSRPNPLNETTKVHMSLQIKNIVHNRNEMVDHLFQLIIYQLICLIIKIIFFFKHDIIKDVHFTVCAQSMVD